VGAETASVGAPVGVAAVSDAGVGSVAVSVCTDAVADSVMILRTETVVTSTTVGVPVAPTAVSGTTVADVPVNWAGVVPDVAVASPEPS
jgi:hypothetical protein